MNENRKGILLAISSAACFSLIPIIGKLTLSNGLPWQVIVFYRGLIPVFLLGEFFLWKKRSVFRISLKEAPLLLLNGLLFAGNFIAFFVALYYIPATIATVLLYTLTIFVAIFSRLILKEKITLTKVIAISLSISGIALVLQVFDPGAFECLNPVGVLFGISAAVVCGLYTVLTKHLGKTNDSWTIIFWNFTIATCLFVVLFLPDVLAVEMTASDWAGVLGVSTLPTLGGYSFYFLSMRYIEASKTGLFVTLDPVLSITMAILILGESLSLLQFGGCLLVLAGIVFMEKGQLLINKIQEKRADLAKEGQG